MSVGDTVHLGHCVDQLSQQFDNCLAKVLADSQTQSEYGEHEGEDSVATCIAELKNAFLNFERNIKELRLRALSDREFAVHQSVELLKRDIQVKKEAITKYKQQLDEWSQELPKLAEKSQKTVQLRTDGKDFDEPIVHKYKAPSQIRPEKSDNEEYM